VHDPQVVFNPVGAGELHAGDAEESFLGMVAIGKVADSLPAFAGDMGVTCSDIGFVRLADLEIKLAW